MTIKVQIRWRYKEHGGIIEDDFGYPEFTGTSEQIEGLMFWYEEGNGACDCNRSLMCGLPIMKCGNEIKFHSIVPLIGETK